MRVSNHARIKSSVNHAKIINSIGLTKKFQLTDLAAQQAGHHSGELTLTAPNNSLFDTNYTYYVQVGGKQYSKKIPPDHFRSYYAAVHDLTTRLTREAERTFHELHYELNAFLDKVQASLNVKHKSPALMALNELSGEPEDEPTAPVLQNNSFDICHYNDMLLADLNDQPVPLGQASLLYQPVIGTKSTYYLIARTSLGVNIAARYTPDCVLKLRAFSSWQSEEAEKVKANLIAHYGFSPKKAGHLGAMYKDLIAQEAQQALYSLLTVFDPEHLVTGLPQIHDFKG